MVKDPWCRACGVQPRLYRNRMGKDRFQAISVSHADTDLWIGVSTPELLSEGFKSAAVGFLKQLHAEAGKLNDECPDFFSSLKPLRTLDSGYSWAMQMHQASCAAETGPLAAVAGSFAQKTGEFLLQTFILHEVLVENGGDLWCSIRSPLTVELAAGKSPLSGKLGLIIPPEYSPLGICTSSGTFGHSYSAGNADAVTVCCRDAALADAWATSLANRVKTESDIETIMEIAGSCPDILGCIVIFRDQIGAAGKFELTVL